MASFDEHINQAKKNLNFLESVNRNVSDAWDWQVTVAFYSSLHMINAHIAQKSNNHYRSHEAVNEAINPHNITSVTKLGEELYTAYIKLQNLSRRARYLCHEDPKNRDAKLHLTYDKHFSKAIKNLDKIMDFMAVEYRVAFKTIEVKCLDLGTFNSSYIKTIS